MGAKPLQISRFIRVMLSGKETNGNWAKTYKRITEFKKEIGQQFQSSSIKAYNSQLLDLVLDGKESTKPKAQVLRNLCETNLLSSDYFHVFLEDFEKNCFQNHSFCLLFSRLEQIFHMKKN